MRGTEATLAHEPKRVPIDASARLRQRLSASSRSQSSPSSGEGFPRPARLSLRPSARANLPSTSVASAPMALMQPPGFALLRQVQAGTREPPASAKEPPTVGEASSPARASSIRPGSVSESVV